MSVEHADVVDAVGVEKSSSRVILTISDHLDWEDTEAHLLTLQGKINAYLAFIEGGQILSAYPQSKGRKLVIEVVFQFQPPPDALHFLEHVRSSVEPVEIEFRSRVSEVELD